MIYRNLQYDYEKIKFKHKRMLYLLHLLLSGYHNGVNPRLTSITLNPCYLSHILYTLGSTLHANLLKHNHYKAKKSIDCNSYLNELEIFKTSI